MHWCWHWFDILEVVVVLALAAWEETAGAREANLCLGTSWEQAALMGTWNNLGTKEELYSTFFCNFKKTENQGGTFFNQGACSMKCDNLEENRAVKEFGEIKGKHVILFVCVGHSMLGK